MATTVRGRSAAKAEAPERSRAGARRSGAEGGSLVTKPGKRKVPVEVEDISKRALQRHARERLDRINEIRDAARLSKSGLGQRDIAEVLRTTQPRVHRMLKAAQSLPLEEETPEELILRAAIEPTDRARLVKRLSSMTYTFKRYAPTPFDGAVSGTWDQVKAAVVAGLLTPSEYEEVRGAVRPPS